MLRIISIVTLISFVLGGVTSVLISRLSIFSEERSHIFLAFLLVTFLVETFLLYGTFERRAWVFGRIFWRARRDLDAISITFDDGPNEPYTSQILDVLKSLDVKATFFVIGMNVEAFPDAVRREVAEGHEIGNHTYDHGVLPLRSCQHIKNQLTKTGNIVEQIAGVKPMLFRAPHGWRNPWVNRCAGRVGCTAFAWTLGVWDTDLPGVDAIVERTLKGLTGGCVLLLHDGRDTEHGADASQLVRALPRIILGARQAGYRFLKLSELMMETGRK